MLGHVRRGWTHRRIRWSSDTAPPPRVRRKSKIEIGCSSLLIAGLATPLATLPLLAQIVTIQLFVYPRPGASISSVGIEGAAGLLGRIPLSVHQLLFRLAIAGVFLPAGLLKLKGWEMTVALFQDEYKVPVLAPAAAAVLATMFEDLAGG